MCILEDALTGTVIGSGGLSRQNVMRDARIYLTRPSRDLSMVCNLAGLEMQSVIDRMKAQIAKAPTPEELAGC